MRRPVVLLIDDELLAEIDRQAIASNLSRSDFVIKIVLPYLAEHCQSTEVEPTSGDPSA